VIDLSSAGSPKSLPVVSISKQAPQRFVALRRATVRSDWPRTSAEVGVVEVGELVTVIESRILTDSGQQRLRLDRGGWISAATVEGTALLQKVFEPQLAVEQSRSLTPTSSDDDGGDGAEEQDRYAESDLPYDPLAAATVVPPAAAAVAASGQGSSVSPMSPPISGTTPVEQAVATGLGGGEPPPAAGHTVYQPPPQQQQQAGSVNDGSLAEIEQLRQQERNLYDQILTLNDEQIEALAPEAREQVRCDTTHAIRYAAAAACTRRHEATCCRYHHRALHYRKSPP